MGVVDASVYAMAADAETATVDWIAVEARQAESALARNSLMVETRAGAILGVIRDAASSDAEIGALWARIQTEFHDNQRAIVQSIADKHALVPRLDVASATGIPWALNHPMPYSLLARERHWSTKRYERWLADLFCAQLLRDSAEANR